MESTTCLATIASMDCSSSSLSSLDDVKTSTDGLAMRVLYGSETGTAQDVAEQIWKSAQRKQLQSTVLSLDEYDMQNLPFEQLIVFVVATTGQGDPPSNMKTFWRHLLSKSIRPDLLQNLKYGVLGLGDSSYSKFNFAAKKLNKRLEQLSAKELLPIGLADDQHNLGIDAVIDPWIKKLWEEIANVFKISIEDKIQENLIIEKYHISILNRNDFYTSNLLISNDGWVISLPNKSENIYEDEIYVNVNVKLGNILANQRTTSDDHFQDVRLISILLPQNIKYDPGDVVYIRPKNTMDQVNRFFNILHENNVELYSNTMVVVTKKEIKVPSVLQKCLTLETIVEQYWDLNFKPRRSTMYHLSLISENELEKEKLCELASPEGQEEFYDYINRPRRNILEVLADFPHTASKINIGVLFEIMSPIKPRPYSIASSSKLTPNIIQIIVAVVKYKTRLLEPRFGLCSKWLASLERNDKIIFRFQKGTFQFKENKPMILIGPGTGVAPLISFLLEKKAEDKDLNECALFFGCRNEHKDFHFREDILRLTMENNLKVFCAFSRDQINKIYVQHIIREQKELCWQFLQNDGSIYLAGSSKNMPNDVRNEFIHLVQEKGGMQLEQAQAFIKYLEKNNRYQMETWG